MKSATVRSGLVLALSFVLLQASCSNSVTSNDDPLTTVTSKYLTSFTANDLKLENLTSCEDLNAKLRIQAKASLESVLADYNPCIISMIGIEDSSTGSSSTTSSESSSSSNVSYTPQNSQVQGIVEPDTVIYNASMIVALSSGDINIYQAWPVDLSGPIATISHSDGRWTYSFSKFFLKDNVLHVFGSAYYSGVTSSSSQSYAAWFRYDVSDPAHPQALTATLMKNGSWLDARLKDSDEIVAVFQKNISLDFDTYPESDLSWDETCTDEGEVTNAYQTLVANHITSESANIDSESLADDDLPQFKSLDLDSLVITSDFNVACTEFKANTYITGTQATVILVESGNRSAQLEDAVVSNDTTVYMNHDSLVLASSTNSNFVSVLGADQKQIDASVLHVFEWSSSVATTNESLDYAASGIVPGTIASQWSLDVDGDVLRVATAVHEENSGSASDVVLSVLTRNGDFLNLSGQVTDLVSGEEIFATRYVGNTVYLVTYEISHCTYLCDPLFVIDTSDVTHPVLLGQLEMPGFSSYLQLVDDGLLLGVGVADPSCWWDSCSGSEVKLSLYDVTDAALPIEIDQETVSTDWISNFDITHLSVHYETSRDQLFIPYEVSDWSGTTTTTSSGVAVYQRTAANMAKIEDLSVDTDVVGSIQRTVIYSDDSSSALIVVGDEGIAAFDAESWEEL